MTNSGLSKLTQNKKLQGTNIQKSFNRMVQFSVTLNDPINNLKARCLRDIFCVAFLGQIERSQI